MGGHLLPHLRPDDIEATDIRQNLHTYIPVRHPAIDHQMLQIGLRVQLHAVNNGSCLERISLDGSAGDVCWRGVGGQTNE